MTYVLLWCSIPCLWPRVLFSCTVAVNLGPLLSNDFTVFYPLAFILAKATTRCPGKSAGNHPPSSQVFQVSLSGSDGGFPETRQGWQSPSRRSGVDAFAVFWRATWDRTSRAELSWWDLVRVTELCLIRLPWYHTCICLITSTFSLCLICDMGPTFDETIY